MNQWINRLFLQFFTPETMFVNKETQFTQYYIKHDALKRHNKMTDFFFIFNWLPQKKLKDFGDKKKLIFQKECKLIEFV